MSEKNKEKNNENVNEMSDKDYKLNRVSGRNKSKEKNMNKYKKDFYGKVINKVFMWSFFILIFIFMLSV